jgi:DNA-binding SARP family transcriptional activator
VRFLVLGPVQVQVGDGRLMPIRSRRRRLLLGLHLLSPGQVISVRRTLEAVWPDYRPDPALVNVAVARLRAQLANWDAKAAIETVGDGYRFRADRYEVDLGAFDELVKRQLAVSPADDLARTTEALDLWRGEPLGGEVGSSEWPEVAALTARYWQTVDRWADLAVQGQHWQELTARLAVLTKRAPLRESLWAYYITALRETGRTDEAVAAYRQCESVLAAELGITPSAGTRAAFDRIPTALTGRTGPRVSPAMTSPGTTERLLRAALLDAANYASETGDFDQAIRAYHALLEAGGLDAVEEAAVLLAVGKAVHQVRGDSWTPLIRAADACRTLGDTCGTADAELLLSEADTMAGRPVQARARLLLAVDLLAQAGPGPRRDRALTVAAQMLAVDGSHPRAIALAQLAERSTRRRDGGGAKPTITATIALGITRLESGAKSGLYDVVGAVNAHRAEYGWVPVKHLVHLATAFSLGGDLTSATRALQEVARSTATLSPYTRRWVTAELAQMALWRGHRSTAERLNGPLINDIGKYRHHTDPIVYGIAASLRLASADRPAALELAETALDHARGSADTSVLTSVLTTTARCRLAIGDTSGATTLVDETLSLLEGRLVSPETALHLPGNLNQLGRSVTELTEAAPADSPWLTTMTTAEATTSPEIRKPS